jgi:phospholipase/carboxylesterase
MRTDRIGKLTARIAGGVDREGGGDGPVVVLLHGFRAPGHDLVSLQKGLDVPSETRFVFPEGHIALDRVYGEARAWWIIDFQRIERAKQSGDLDPIAFRDPPGLDEAREIVVSFLDETERRFGVSGESLILGGFSQGANLSTDIALRTKRKLAGLVHLSGSVICQEIWRAQLAARKTLPVFISHGTNDPVLPYALAERLRDLWREAGNDPEWVSFRGGHEIPWSVTEKLGAFLTSTIARSS